MSFFRKCMKFNADIGTIVGPGRFEEIYVARECEHGIDGHIDFWTASRQDIENASERSPQSVTEFKFGKKFGWPHQKVEDLALP